MRTFRLSKSKYMAGLQCEKRLWYEVHRPELKPEPPAFQQRIFDQGTLVGELAREQFPGGVLIEADYRHLSEGAQETIDAIERGATVIFEGVISYDDIRVRPDVIRLLDSGSWELIEVKSSTGVKKEYVHDITVQTHVLNGAGMKVEKACLMHVNRECVYPDLSNLFEIVDVTERVLELLPSVPEKVEAFREMLATDEEPDIPVGRHCEKPYLCSYKEYCWRNVPDYSIFRIPHMRWDEKEKLLAEECVELDLLPPEVVLSDDQHRFIDSYVRKDAVIDIVAVREMLAGLEYPIHYLDFETDNPAVPRFEGMSPYGMFPFQWSCHIVEEEGPLIHMEYLHDSMTDPRRPLTDSLLEAIGPKGSIVVYHAPFEKRVLGYLAECFPGHAEVLNSLIERIWDQLLVFRDHYTDYRFRGSNSLKSVLPVLVPSMGYEGMDVSEGGEAQTAWNEMIRLPEGEERDRLAADLKEYCGMDTRAMVEIMRVLEQI